MVMFSSRLAARESVKILLILIGLILLPSLATPRSLASSPGILDTSFNGSGVALAPLWTGSYGVNVAVQTDGKLAVVGTVGGPPAALARFTTNGLLDTTFGPNGNGTLTTLIGPATYFDGIALQTDGKLVIVGYNFLPGFSKLVLARYTTSGLLDTTFGPNGNGTLTTRIGTSTYPHGVAIQSNGEIVVSGDAYFAPGYRFFVARYTSSGVLDTTFGPSSNGTLTTAIGIDAHGAHIAIQGDGKIVIGGYATFPGTHEFAMARYTTNGLLDTTFGPQTNGTLTTAIGTGGGSVIYSLKIQGDGKIVAAGDAFFGTCCRFALARYTSGGLLDTTFGPNANGTLTTLIGTGDHIPDVAIQINGKIVLAGYATFPGTDKFALARYTTGGLLDTTFGIGTNGTMTTLIGYYAVAQGVAIQSDGKIVVTGYAHESTGDALVVARYTGDSTDFMPPNWPSGSTLAASIANSTTIILNWTPANDDVGVTNYLVYQGATLLATVPESDYSYAVAHLTPGATYTFTIQASDAANNTSTNGPTTTVKMPKITSAAPTLPSLPLTLALSFLTITAVRLALRRRRTEVL
jgi:uncharacterized delta-60 repeat protein